MQPVSWNDPANTLKTTSLVGELSILRLSFDRGTGFHGEFYEIPEYLFFKEIIRTRQCEHIAHSKNARWYDPAKRAASFNKMEMVLHLAAIRRVRMS